MWASLEAVLIWSCLVLASCDVVVQRIHRLDDTRYTTANLTLTSTSALGCSRACHAWHWCKIFNYSPAEGVCELAHPTAGSSTSNQTGWEMYYEDLCASQPCQNGGVCTSHLGTYTCTCAQGWGGDTCFTLIGCLSGWLSVGSSCYYIVRERANRDEAQQHCVDLVPIAGLAVIRSADEQSALRSYVQSEYMAHTLWIDAKIPKGDFQAYWSDGSLASYTAWAPGEPNSYGFFVICLVMWYDWGYTWADQSCTSEASAMCEYTVSVG